MPDANLPARWFTTGFFSTLIGSGLVTSVAGIGPATECGMPSG